MNGVPKKKYGNDFRYDWKNSIGGKIGVRINNIYVYYTIVDFNTKTGDITLTDKEGNTNTLNRWIFKSNKKDVAANKITREYLYSENTEINGYKIIKQIRVLNPVKKGSTIKGYTVQCLNCGKILDLSENNIIRKNNGFCKYCSPKCRKGINDMWTTHSYLAKLLKNPEDGYKYKITYSNKKIEWVCPNCGEIIYASPNIVFTRGLCCRRCSDKITLPEKIMYNILRLLNIKFEYQKILPYKSFIFEGKEYTPSYDFYFFKNDKKYIIEMDGGFHKKVHIKSNMTFEQIQLIDSEKDKLALKNNCIMIRIEADKSDFNYIYNNIKSNKILQSLFNFSDDLKIKTLEYCCINNLTKEICEYYDNNTKNMHQIAEHFNVSYSHVYASLKNGATLNWTNYDPQKQQSIIGTKPLYSIVCNELSLIFKDLSVLVDKSFEYFGFIIHDYDIHSYFSENRGDIHGYTFKYIPYNKCDELEKILPNAVIS